jgi:hypothetical protein
MLLRAAFAIAVLASIGLQQAAASERLLKLRQYTFGCGTAQECVGWRHSFAYIDPAARNAELPRDAYVEVYTTREVEELIDLREREIRAELSGLIDEAMAKRPGVAAAVPTDADRRQFRDEIATEIVAQMARMMAEHESQTRAWLRELVREEMRAAAPAPAR